MNGGRTTYQEHNLQNLLNSSIEHWVMSTNCNYSNRGNHLYNKAVYYNVAFHKMHCICGDTNNQNQAHTINELSGRCTDCDAQILAPQFPPFFHEV